MLMAENVSNIVLIGMPGSGKSTVGVILAKMTSRDFVDTDVLMQTSRWRARNSPKKEFVQKLSKRCGQEG